MGNGSTKEGMAVCSMLFRFGLFTSLSFSFFLFVLFLSRACIRRELILHVQRDSRRRDEMIFGEMICFSMSWILWGLVGSPCRYVTGKVGVRVGGLAQPRLGKPRFNITFFSCLFVCSPKSLSKRPCWKITPPCSILPRIVLFLFLCLQDSVAWGNGWLRRVYSYLGRRLVL
jgi:hypothetical protein